MKWIFILLYRNRWQMRDEWKENQTKQTAYGRSQIGINKWKWSILSSLASSSAITSVRANSALPAQSMATCVASIGKYIYMLKHFVVFVLGCCFCSSFRFIAVAFDAFNVMYLWCCAFMDNSQIGRFFCLFLLLSFIMHGFYSVLVEHPFNYARFGIFPNL